MNARRLTLAIAVSTLFAATAFAQNAASEIQRDVNQQQRIEQGLQSGQLTTREAARLEREESRVDNMQSKAMNDGRIDPREAQRTKQAQDRVSRDIHREKHDAQRGDPNSPSAQRMQADVQRNINQQQRIGQGLRSGQLSNREAGRLERGQGRDSRMEARAGADGQVGHDEQRHMQMAENRQSGQIHNERHDGQQRQQGERRNGQSENRGTQDNNGPHGHAGHH